MARDFLKDCGPEIGLNEQLWLTCEDAYGAAATTGLFPTDTDAVEHLSFNLAYTQPREDSEARSGRSLATRLSQKIEVTFTSEFYIISAEPTGGGNDEPGLPDIHPLLLSCFGSVDETDPLKKVYNFVSCNDKSFRAYLLGDRLSRLGLGMVASQATFSLSGDDMAKVSFEGFGQTDLYAGVATLSAPAAASNDLVLQTGEGYLYDVGQHVHVIDQGTGAETASNREILSINGDTLTVDGAAITAAANDLVTPVDLDATGVLTSDKALVGLSGDISIDGLGSLTDNCTILSAEINVNQNLSPQNAIFGTDRICGFLNDNRREVTISLEVQIDDKGYDLYRRARRFQTSDIRVQLKPNDGSSAVGKTWTWDLDRVEFDIPEIEYPNEGAVVVTFEGRALSSSASNPNDELVLTIGPENP